MTTTEIKPVHTAPTAPATNTTPVVAPAGCTPPPAVKATAIPYAQPLVPAATPAPVAAVPAAI